MGGGEHGGGHHHGGGTPAAVRERLTRTGVSCGDMIVVCFIIRTSFDFFQRPLQQENSQKSNMRIKRKSPRKVHNELISVISFATAATDD